MRNLKHLFLLGILMLGACVQIENHEPPTKIQKNVQELTPDMAMHLLRSTVRVNAGSSVGTGVIVYSQQKQSDLDPRFYSYILTCAHVADNASQSNPPKIETFYYLDNNSIVAAASFQANIVLMDQELDIAVLQVISPKPLQDKVSIANPRDFYDYKIYNSVYVVGCAIGKLPYITNGNIASYYFEHQVDGQPVSGSLRISSPTIYGNSGGGVFSPDGKLMGIVRSIDLVHGTFYEHSAYAVPIWKVALLLRNHKLDFILGYPGSIDSFANYQDKQSKLSKIDEEEKEFRKSLLEALDKISAIAPTTSISINIAPVISETPAPIASPTPILIPTVPRRWQ